MQKEKNSSHKVRLKPYTYLALGDSYTIGEGVEKKDSFPYQLVAELQKHHLTFLPPTVIAQTGWTTRDLREGIGHAQVSGQTYDLVTLLIGVNNQYRGLKVDEYQNEFSELVEQAIQFGGGNPERVIVLSIPDWGVTPFAHGRPHPLEKITLEIDQFNQISQKTSKHKNVFYLDITQNYRKIGGLPENLAKDQLHPSGNIYNGWVKGLRKMIFSGMDIGLSSISNHLNQDKKQYD
jgi:lysophospholipase L1-like esterase